MFICQVMVNGITYVISLVCKKTEFYADQRENRQFISTISNGLKVLDICSHSGGFALNVVHGGAIDATGIILCQHFSFGLIHDYVG